MKNLVKAGNFRLMLILAGLCTTMTAGAQLSSKDRQVINDAATAKAAFIRTDAGMASRFANAYGYVIFPNVGKGGIGIGGAAGNGVAYEHGARVGMAKLTQVSVGFQFGGQSYREVVFFENKAAMDKFKANNIEFSAQASAVAVTAGASANASFKDGTMIFTQAKGGLMYEAAIGGQKLKYTKKL